MPVIIPSLSRLGPPRSQATYLPLSVWAQHGWGAEQIQATANKHNSKPHARFGMAYKVEVESDKRVTELKRRIETDLDRRVQLARAKRSAKAKAAPPR